MGLSARIFVAYFLLVGLAAILFLQTVTDELTPGMRQSLEEVLVDTANLLAELAREDLEQGKPGDGFLAQGMAAFSQRRLNAVIYSLHKREPGLIVYVTDARGVVVFDSRGRDLGQDYSRWHDVYRTLRGEYGARSTRENPEDPLSSVMYVAAPILDGERILGVLTVGKPSVTVLPFVEAAKRNLREKGLWLFATALVLGGAIAFWLTRSIRRLTRYAQEVQAGRRVQPPRLREGELALLARAMGDMREELEGKHYVEGYLHALTHELKSPLSAITGAAELLDGPMPEETRRRFLGNIRSESARLREIVDRLLALAALEKRQSLEKVETVPLTGLVRELVGEREPVLSRAGVGVRVDCAENAAWRGERFLLHQAAGNLLDNAIEFSPRGGEIEIRCEPRDQRLALVIRDQGPGIPPYAHERLFERFYSLPRPDGGTKSSGLGLSLVKEVGDLHQGRVSVENHPSGGAVATLELPADQVNLRR